MILLSEIIFNDLAAESLVLWTTKNWNAYDSQNICYPLIKVIHFLNIIVKILNVPLLVILEFFLLQFNPPW